MTAFGLPKQHTLDEAQRLAEIIASQDAPLRMLGGTAIYLHSPSAASDPLQRAYNDIDLVGLSSRRAEMEGLIEEAGYEPNREFNALWGHARLLYHDPTHSRQLDVFVDKFVMCHTFDLRGRGALDSPTLPLADLLMTKLQIVEMNRKDALDIIALLHDHPLGDHSVDTIDLDYIASIAANDWGIWRTFQGSLETVLAVWQELGSEGPYAIEPQISAILEALDRAPKSLSWKMRAQIGERMRWYELPEEVNLD